MAAPELSTPCSQLIGGTFHRVLDCLAEQLIAGIAKAQAGLTPLAIEVAYAALTETFDATNEQTIEEWFRAACRQADVPTPLLFV